MAMMFLRNPRSTRVCLIGRGQAPGRERRSSSADTKLILMLTSVAPSAKSCRVRKSRNRSRHPNVDKMFGARS